MSDEPEEKTQNEEQTLTESDLAQDDGAELAEKALAQAVGGAVDLFLKIDGIKGESQDEKYKDDIHIDS